jgi:hypothetical protein
MSIAKLVMVAEDRLVAFADDGTTSPRRLSFWFLFVFLFFLVKWLEGGCGVEERVDGVNQK